MKIVFKKERKDLKNILAEKWGAMTPVTPPVPTPMCDLLQSLTRGVSRYSMLWCSLRTVGYRATSGAIVPVPTYVLLLLYL